MNNCIVIPCYNESKTLSSISKQYGEFLLENKETILCFVNDCSTDNTGEYLNNFKLNYNGQVHILENPKNLGKAESVRAGINYCLENFNCKYIGFLDADLATPFSEFNRILNKLKNTDYTFAFGSRIAIVGTTIKRSFFRFFVGRIIATFISRTLDLIVYDTQCGAKAFEAETASKLFNEEFISRWLFDVELFFRMFRVSGKDKAIEKMIEVPLHKWIDPGDSKVSFTYFFKLWSDLFKINRKYKQYK